MSVDRPTKTMQFARDLRGTGYVLATANAFATGAQTLFPKQTAQLDLFLLSHTGFSQTSEQIRTITEIANGHAIFDPHTVWEGEIFGGILLPAVLILASKGIERYARRNFRQPHNS